MLPNNVAVLRRFPYVRVRKIAVHANNIAALPNNIAVRPNIIAVLPCSPYARVRKIGVLANNIAVFPNITAVLPCSPYAHVGKIGVLANLGGSVPNSPCSWAALARHARTQLDDRECQRDKKPTSPSTHKTQAQRPDLRRRRQPAQADDGGDVEQHEIARAQDAVQTRLDLSWCGGDHDARCPLDHTLNPFAPGSSPGASGLRTDYTPRTDYALTTH